MDLAARLPGSVKPDIATETMTALNHREAAKMVREYKPSQWIVDVVYPIKVIGIISTMLIFLGFGLFRAVPVVWSDGIMPVIQSHVKQNDALTDFILKQQDIINQNSASIVTISNLLDDIDKRLKKEGR